MRTQSGFFSTPPVSVRMATTAASSRSSSSRVMGGCLCGPRTLRNFDGLAPFGFGSVTLSAVPKSAKAFASPNAVRRRVFRVGSARLRLCDFLGDCGRAFVTFVSGALERILTFLIDEPLDGSDTLRPDRSINVISKLGSMTYSVSAGVTRGCKSW